MSRRTLAIVLGGLALGLSLAAGCATGPPGAYHFYPGYGCLTDDQIEQLPLLDRPDRPGHCVGNTLRAIDRCLSGDPASGECDPCE
jgi:hypothetical protein